MKALKLFIGALMVSPILSLEIVAAAVEEGIKAKSESSKQAKCPEFLNYDFPILHSSKTINLCQKYKNKPLLIVNTASHCGYTPQFKGLEALYQKYKAEGVEIIGFASDDFKQEAKNEEAAAAICYTNYGVTFTMLSPTVVSGPRANPVFAYLAGKTSSPRWNFYKYLVSEQGNKVQQFISNIEPMNSKLEEALIEALQQP